MTTPTLLLVVVICRLISTVGLTVEPDDAELLRLGSVGSRLSLDPSDIEEASGDFGGTVRTEPLAVLHPSSAGDVAALVRSAYGSVMGFPVSARGHGHCINGQAGTAGGVVVEMNRRGGWARGEGTQPRPPQYSARLGGYYVDVWGGELWIDVLRWTLRHGGLAPVSWTDYLYLSVGGTLSNAGISGQAFQHGPQISNVYEMDVVTGKGEVMTCSNERNPDLFHAVLGGLGQFGIITRARIALEPAPQRVGLKAFLCFQLSIAPTTHLSTPCQRRPRTDVGVCCCSQKLGAKTRFTCLFGPFHCTTKRDGGMRRARFVALRRRVRWIRVLYSDFTAFTRDQEYLISLQGRPPSERFDYIEGFVIVDEGLVNNWRSSFFSPRNPVKISSLDARGSVLYCLEVARNYHDSAADSVDQPQAIRRCTTKGRLGKIPTWEHEEEIFRIDIIPSSLSYFKDDTREVEALLRELHFMPATVFTTDLQYVDFLDRVHKKEVELRAKGLWDVPHPWLNLFVPASRIADFDHGVFKGILGRNKTSGPILIYPMNRSK
ncbi:hypothetical protein Taro_038763 [Colocasia esculenta]|uniref:cytokinin dehydrogenase n=1 Tax=Colocasia esculenta TaxID=4460 RepID=A0A843WDR9_COLES|nr:hypothetical protein [Colocasia esculenta]